MSSDVILHFLEAELENSFIKLFFRKCWLSGNEITSIVSLWYINKIWLDKWIIHHRLCLYDIFMRWCQCRDFLKPHFFLNLTDLWVFPSHFHIWLWNCSPQTVATGCMAISWFLQFVNHTDAVSALNEGKCKGLTEITTIYKLCVMKGAAHNTSEGCTSRTSLCLSLNKTAFFSFKFPESCSCFLMIYYSLKGQPSNPVCKCHPRKP